MHIQIDNSPALPDSLPDSLRSMATVLRVIMIIWLADMLKLLKAGDERKETESSFSDFFVTNYERKTADKKSAVNFHA